MNLFYAMGGGMGHLSRVHTFINQFHISPYKILTNNPLAEKLFNPENILYAEGKTITQVSRQVSIAIHSTAYNELHIDTFPVGLFGELNTIKANIKTHYLARRLKWDAYKALVKNIPVFNTTYCFEELEPAHETFLQKTGKNILATNLQYPAPNPARIPAHLIPEGKPLWLVVHAFIREETEALVSYAKEIAALENYNPVFVVLTDQQIDIENVFCYTYFPAYDWFPLADRIFVGGGFNSLQQAAPYRHKTTAMPFPRKYDDQFWRVDYFKRTH